MRDSLHGLPALILAATIASAGAAHAQSGGWNPFVSVTPVYQGKAGLDGGGDYSAGTLSVRAGVSRDLAGGHRAGVTLNYEVTDYSFSSPASFGGAAPWGTVQRYGIATPLIYSVNNDWSVGFSPSADWLRENGADSGDSLSWGAIVSANRRFADGNRIGFGLGVYDRIEKTLVFPLLLVDWRFNDRWRLVNPLPAGPTGPAGLELDYRFDRDWTLGLGAAWRSVRFRLSDTGPTPGGVGGERGAPVFLRATRSFGDGVALHLYGGVVLAGQLRVEDGSGNILRKVDFDPAPLVGATLSARF
ncbi:MAG: DUF6268 family outer membrane beta-barrel protein [Burkholderiales bacterium]